MIRDIRGIGTASTPATKTGAILTRFADNYGRAVAFAFPDGLTTRRAERRPGVFGPVQWSEDPLHQLGDHLLRGRPRQRHTVPPANRTDRVTRAKQWTCHGFERMHC